MAVTHLSSIRSAFANLITTQLDAGATNALLQLQTSASAAVATPTFSKPSFPAASSGFMTANAITADTSAASGTIAQAYFADSAGNQVVKCSVTSTSGGGDILMNSVVVSSGQTVSITSLTYTACP